MQRAVDDEWRRWIAENLMLDNAVESIFNAMTANGFAAQDARREIDAALSSPYVRGSERLRNRLKKRDWMLGVYRTLYRMRASAGRVERRERLGADEFFEQYYYQNRPVVMTGMLDDWPAMRLWRLAYFRERFGDREVEVQVGRDSDPDFEVNQPRLRRTMRFRDYVDLVERTSPTNDFYMTANNTSHNRDALAELWDDVGPLPGYLDADSADKGFFWLGPAGTKTPFHHDLTNNFMAQIMGRKRVLLAPLHDTPHMYNHLHCYSMVDASQLDAARFPDLRDAQLIECMLGPGELLFLPIGWWHYVEGLDVSATMTFINFVALNDFGRNYATYHSV
jgi:ribosomal protein L16 Arg81 hydroxylase